MQHSQHIRIFEDFLNILHRSTDLLNEDPIREEIFSVERLEQYAAYLANELRVVPDPNRGRSLLPGLKASGKELLAAYQVLVQAIRSRHSISPAAEWFVDNFHIVEDQLREIRQNLPEKYYSELPKLSSGPLKGFPRVYAIALAILAYTDSRLDPEGLRRFIKAFQKVEPLQIGEVWAVSITLRIALVEHLKPLTLRVVSARRNREKADELADKLLAHAKRSGSRPEELVGMLSAELKDTKQFDRAFIVQLIQRLRDQEPDVWLAFDWLETQLATHYKTTTQLVTQLDHHRKATAQVTIGNIITSMRLLSTMDWRDFFEDVSVADTILAKDPSGVYDRMDFATRDRYRHAIERIARRLKRAEVDVAQRVVDLSAQATSGDATHIGYYLIGEGLAEFEALLGYSPAFTERLSRFARKHPTLSFLSSFIILLGILLVPVLAYLSESGAPLWATIAFGALSLVPLSDFALSFLNHSITRFITPLALPKLDLEKGIPFDARTMVVIPTLFTRESVVKELIENLHVHSLANQDPSLTFAILSDFGDATAENCPGDAQLLEIAEEGIRALNERYAAEGEDRFFLFHRRRKWNGSEGKFMGWERKRGKIHEFNRLLRGATNTSYVGVKARFEFLAQIKYVITLDSDTQLPRDAARQLVATILHPLNQPYYDAKKGRVTKGYGILQPRISVSLLSAASTRFALIFSGNTGLDPYTTAVSDVYQDLFAEGSYTGKGLYVVDAFEQALEDRIPENALLSHDLFEGSYARSALVTDVELFDDYPADYETFAKRQHRWTRGDWQIAGWLGRRVPNALKSSVPNNLSLISRWKIFDNLRRSLVPPSVLLWLFLAWTILPGSAWLWTGAIVAMFAFPVYAPIGHGLLVPSQGMPWQGHFRNVFKDGVIQIRQILLTICYLPHQAWSQIDAVLRTGYRKFFSRKNLLEWVSFAQTQQKQDRKNSRFCFTHAVPVFAIVVALLVAIIDASALWVAAPFIGLWLCLPLINTWTLGKPVHRRRPLGQQEVETYRAYARRTWRFFETFVGPEGNWLAPDNFQEDPTPVVAFRTSPTNIGLQLLSTISAFDLGYIGALEFVERCELTFVTLQKLPRFKGHFYNWYETRTLEALRPQYISTVDSGNLAGHLIAFKQACLEFGSLGPIRHQARAGLRDTLFQLKFETQSLEIVVHNSGAATPQHFEAAIQRAIDYVSTTQWTNVAEWGEFVRGLLTRLHEADDILSALAVGVDSLKFGDIHIWMAASLHQAREFKRDLEAITPHENILRQRLQSLADQSEKFVEEMDFRFLFDEQRKIFVIGYNATDGRLDKSYYDLLASESRLPSFVAIAKGDVPKEHWFHLGRQMTPAAGSRALVSWTATMFEYLMPVLVMRRYDNTLLEQTYEAVVARQIEYGKQRGVPWGISEAGYNARDLQLNYQYGPFGVPGLGLKRGLSHDLVVSPYSTFLASAIDPWAALSNLQHLEQIGVYARYGFYESVDYTAERLQKKQKSFILRSFMAHHEGMSLVSINNLLHDNVMPERFHAEPMVQATQLLLQERIPLQVRIAKPRAEEVKLEGSLLYPNEPNARVYTEVDLPTPRTQLLSNGNYSVMISSVGSGYSRCGSLAVSRWREDVTRDNWGQFLYIRNRKDGKVWSATHQPLGQYPDRYEASFTEDRVEFWRQDGTVATHTEILVSPEDNVELRRVSLTNYSSETCELEITSFMETVLAPPADDAAHPAFSNLFVQTEFSHAENALLATRRRRSNNEKQIWGFHVLVSEGNTVGAVQYETDRARFIGRGHSSSNPIVITEDHPLSNTVGSVLDPIFSLRQSLRIPAGETMRVTFATGVADSRDEVLRLVDKHHDIHIFTRETELAWTKSQVQLRHLNITSEKAHSYQRLAGRIIYSDPSLRPTSHLLSLSTRTQTSLWAYGISGDVPIVLLRVSEEKDMSMVRELLHAHEYLCLKGLVFDLVILNEHAPSYIQSLQDELLRQARMSGGQALLDKPGGIFIRRADLMPGEDVILLKTVARVTLSPDKGTLEEQLTRRPIDSELPKLLEPSVSKRRFRDVHAALPQRQFFNGLGGFVDGGKEYVISLEEANWTPLPWINVIANEKDFGFTVSESGAGYTWSTNSRENRITPWSNDAVSDPVGEAIYIRDEESGEFWSPTPLPIREREAYVIRHGQGYSQFEHTSHGIEQRLQVFVPMDSEVKISRLRLKNVSDKKRILSVSSYAEWVLGFQRDRSAPYIVTEADPETGTVYARNPYNNEFATRTAFADISEVERSFTCDRKEFLGRHGSAANPAAMSRISLSASTGAGFDPCVAFRSTIELAAGEERVIVVLLGQTASTEEARELCRKYRNLNHVQKAFDEVLKFWEQTLTTIQITTPDESMNTLVNRWLLYQTLSCRLWARSAFYQSGGAYGFRDQLQDVMALVHSQPHLAREQIIRAAARQFPEGDVQHWWHPPTGRGVRTRFSDDLVWLPFVTSFYVKVTGDTSVLREVVPFIDAPQLEEGRDDAYTQPGVTEEHASILQHCIRTLDRSLKVGSHGLPLMGSGDWNDGMSRVGIKGQGESVWMAWFLYTALKEFIPLLEGEEVGDRAEVYRGHMRNLRDSTEANAWDGNWYRRAYFDDGTPMGSALNDECRIDSIAQSWAVLSGGGDKERASRAMDAVDEFLIHRGDGLVKLFTPPFDQGSTDPGYIKGYVPGVRENGGQYTHAAIWTLMAFAALGDGDRAGELYALFNPINHASTRAGLHKYKVEPYVAAADIYGLWPHVGRGGWTWYTGSASWMYRASIESILGFDRTGDLLRMSPRIPKFWSGFELKYRHGKNTNYTIKVINSQEPGGKSDAVIHLDGLKLDSSVIPLVSDGGDHRIEIQL